MYPRLLTTPLFTVHTFGLLLASAYVAAFWWLIREGRREGLRDFPQYAAAPSEMFSLSVFTSAGDFYGGFIGALVASTIFFRRYPRLPFWRTADLCGPAIALGQAIGRIGCFMAGDDFGGPTQLPWAVAFTDPDAARIGGQLHIVSILTDTWIQRDGRLLHRRRLIQPGLVKKNCAWVTWIHALTSLPGHPGVTGIQVRVPS
jgi:phosphatidylglycerol---prolipoprotein diacylglyceryl transferase